MTCLADEIQDWRGYNFAICLRELPVRCNFNSAARAEGGQPSLFMMIKKNNNDDSNADERSETLPLREATPVRLRRPRQGWAESSWAMDGTVS